MSRRINRGGRQFEYGGEVVDTTLNYLSSSNNWETEVKIPAGVLRLNINISFPNTEIIDPIICLILNGGLPLGQYDGTGLIRAVSQYEGLKGKSPLMLGVGQIIIDTYALYNDTISFKALKASGSDEVQIILQYYK